MSEEIEEGHGKTDVSCRHGSRWMWWPGRDGKGEWKQVVWASNCDCSDPPRPNKKEEEADALFEAEQEAEQDRLRGEAEAEAEAEARDKEERVHEDEMLR